MKSLTHSFCAISLLLTVFIAPAFAGSSEDKGYSPGMQAKIEETKKELKKFTEGSRTWGKHMAISAMKSLPAIFIGHGNPMNIIRRNRWTEGWIALGAALPRPRAILAVSAHWYLPATMVTAMPHPRTIHDFGGFPQELYELRYPAPGDPALAGRVRDMLAPIPVELDKEWGLDHGAWSILYHIFPKADIPVVQLSIDRRQPPSFHYEPRNYPGCVDSAFCGISRLW